MARDFYDQFDTSRRVFAEASDALGFDVAALCFDEDPRLDLTEFTQPAILTAEIAMLRPLVENFGLSAAWFGGHSLGEYTALCAAGAIPLDAAVKLVHKRGALMQEAVPAGEGAMMAVSGRGVAVHDFRAALDAIEVDVANLNSPDQIVLSGPAGAMTRACELATEIARQAAEGAATEALEFTPLVVSAPFHSRRMRSIQAEFRAALNEAAPRLVAERAASVTSNVRGGFHPGDEGALLDALERQISGSVDWIANMRSLVTVSDRILEVGPNRPLRRFFQSLGTEITSIVSVRTAERAFATSSDT